MSYREIKKPFDVIRSSDWNDLVRYLINHSVEHELGGEQEVDHNKLKNYDETKHRKIVLNNSLEVIEILI